LLFPGPARADTERIANNSMLQSIRDKTSGWFASVILVMIIVTMAFFGIGDFLTPKVENYTARVESAPKFWMFGADSKEITVEEFRNRFQIVREQQREAQGESFDAAAFEKIENKRLVLDRLIDEAVLELAAKRAGIVISPAQLRSAIAEDPTFHDDKGKFSQNQYLLALKSRGMTVGEYENRIRSGLMEQLVPVEIADTAIAGDAELDTFLRLQTQTRHVRLFAVPPPAEMPAAPTEAEIKGWYDAHAAQYRTPEKVVVDYLELDADSLPPPAAPDEKALRDRYDQEKLRFGAPEQRMASHILVQVDEKAPTAAWDAALAKAKDIAAKARVPGADFAALARQYSDDIGTKDAGGDIGPLEETFTAGTDSLAPLRTALFALQQPGQVSEPVRSASGWHVVQYRELLPGSTKPFEEVRAELEAEYMQSERERAFGDTSGALVDAVYATPASIAQVAAKTGLKVYRSGAFSRKQGEGIGALEPVREAAFEEEQKVARQVSEPVEISPTHVVVVQVVDVKAEAAQPLAEVHDRIAAELAADRAAKAMKAHADKLLARVQAGETIDAVAASVGAAMNDVPAMTRDDQAVPPPIREGAFGLPRPAEGKPQYTLVHGQGATYALMAVDSVTDGDPTKVDAEIRKSLPRQLAQARGIDDRRAYIAALRKQFKIKVVEERL
jgi:peptidyl-prolyl cis-trans isomerase D